MPIGGLTFQDPRSTASQEPTTAQEHEEKEVPEGKPQGR